MVSPSEFRSLFRLRLTTDLPEAAESVRLRIARGTRNAAERLAVRAKLQLRQDVLQAHLGQKVANAWRANVYPGSASTHTLKPAVFIYTKAPKIIAGFSEPAVIRAANGVYLAIPTENTPRLGGVLAKPGDVERMFNQNLVFRPGRGGQMLAFVNAIRAKSGKGFRRATKRRTKDGRENEMVLMFVMVRQVRLRRRLNFADILNSLERKWLDLVAREIAAALAAGSN